MRRWKVIAVVISLVFMVGTAGAEEVKTNFDFGVGYRTDDLDWNVGDEFVNPYSELEWSDLDIIYSKASIRMSSKKVYARGSLGYGRIIDGDTRDSDWALSGRQDEFSRSRANTDGYVFDASMGIGYQLGSGKFTAIPLIGYSWHLQYLNDKDLVQTLCDTVIYPGCILGPIPGYNSTYEPRWQGPWVGVDLNFQPSEKARFFATLEYHFGDYVANAYWNLRDMGFEQIADAEGFVISGGLAYNVKDSWDIGLQADYTKWEADAGTDTVFFSDGSSYDSFLNEVNWQSFSVMLNTTYRFHQLTRGKGRYKNIRSL